MKSFLITFRRWVNGQMESLDSSLSITGYTYQHACQFLRMSMPMEIDIASVVESGYGGG